MRIFSISLIVMVSLIFILGGCTERQEENIKERTNLGMGDMVKAKDRSIEANVKSSLASDPMCKYYGLSAVVSHDVITLLGSVKTKKQKQDAYNIVLSIDLARIKEENIINEILVDPSLDELPFEW